MCHSFIDTGFIVNSNVMYNYPKKYSCQMAKSTSYHARLQRYLTKPKYWKNISKVDEKKDFFLKTFSSEMWVMIRKTKTIPFYWWFCRLWEFIDLPLDQPCTIQQKKMWKIFLKFQTSGKFNETERQRWCQRTSEYVETNSREDIQYKTKDFCPTWN